MDSHGNMINEGFDGMPVEIERDGNGFWATTARFLVAGPFPSHTNARFWLADPQFRERNQTDRFGIPFWCVRSP
jgi:hypothetical protein